MEFFVIILILFLIFLYKVFSKNNLGNIKLSLIIVVILYVLVNIYVIGYSKYLEYKLNSFDLNGDGIFSGSEITSEPENIMNRYIWDTGRTFAPITSGIFCIIIFPIFILLSKFMDIMIIKYKNNNNLLRKNIIRKKIINIKYIHDYIQIFFNDNGVINLFNKTIVKGNENLFINEIVNNFIITKEKLIIYCNKNLFIEMSMLEEDYMTPEAFEYNKNGLIIVD
jgi:hypothetical protein